jgi:uncharacterized membrane protein YphA (DoxX/SURF4 family)
MNLNNPLLDIVAFLTDPIWPTPVFWLLLIGSAAIAVLVWRRFPEQRCFSRVAQWGFRVVIGAMWWQQSLWKLPPLYTNHPEAPLETGLAYWMGQMGKFAAIPLQADLVNTVVLPHFYLFAPIVYAAEVLTGVSLMLGVFARLFGIIGALQILNLWLGLYNAPGEWPWTYFFLLVLQLIFAVHAYGRSLGIDAILVARRGSGREGGTRRRLFEIVR